MFSLKRKENTFRKYAYDYIKEAYTRVFDGQCEQQNGKRQQKGSSKVERSLLNAKKEMKWKILGILNVKSGNRHS